MPNNHLYVFQIRARTRNRKHSLHYNVVAQDKQNALERLKKELKQTPDGNVLEWSMEENTVEITALASIDLI